MSTLVQLVPNFYGLQWLADPLPERISGEIKALPVIVPWNSSLSRKGQGNSSLTWRGAALERA